jgi:hypothetical protein
MKVLTNFINRVFVKEQTPTVLLGRWSIVYCENKINKKIDLANEDHCGTCNIIPDEEKFIKTYIFYEAL